MKMLAKLTLLILKRRNGNPRKHLIKFREVGISYSLMPLKGRNVLGEKSRKANWRGFEIYKDKEIR